MERSYKVNKSLVGINIGSPQKVMMEGVSSVALPSGPYQTNDSSSNTENKVERSYSLPKIHRTIHQETVDSLVSTYRVREVEVNSSLV